MGRVTDDEIRKMNELYLVYHTYSAVAKEVGRAAGTVKRYIDPNFQLEKKELLSIDWDALSALPKIDLMKGSIGGFTSQNTYDDSISAFSLEERPGMKDKYVIINHFDEIPVPRLNTSYRVLEARLLHKTYEEYIDFCSDYLGAFVSRGGKYAGIYFENTYNVQRLVNLLNKKFKESYDEKLYEE